MPAFWIRRRGVSVRCAGAEKDGCTVWHGAKFLGSRARCSVPFNAPLRRDCISKKSPCVATTCPSKAMGMPPIIMGSPTKRDLTPTLSEDKEGEMIGCFSKMKIR